MIQTSKCHLIFSASNEGIDLSKGNLFLGSVSSLHNAIIKGNRFGAVLTVLDQLQYERHHISLVVLKNKLQHMWINAKDKVNQSIEDHFEGAYAFIDEQLSKTNVIVHCQMGKSRSASIVISYLMKKMKIGYEQALSVVQGKRKLVNPNMGFQDQLSIYEKKIESQQKKGD